MQELVQLHQPVHSASSRVEVMSVCADAAKEKLSAALLPLPKEQSDKGAAAVPNLPQVSALGSRGQIGMWPVVWQRIEALEEWLRLQLAQQQRQHSLKVEETFHNLQERLLALEGDRPKLELSMAQLEGSVKGIVEQLTSDAEHKQALEMRQREWRRALEEHLRTELSGAERVREARLQEFHKQLTELQNKLRGRHSLEDAMRTELASATLAELEHGALELNQRAEPHTRALLMAAAGAEVSERLDGLELKLQNCAFNARAAVASHHETLEWQAAKLSELQDHLRCLSDSHEKMQGLAAHPQAATHGIEMAAAHSRHEELASRVADLEASDNSTKLHDIKARLEGLESAQRLSPANLSDRLQSASPTVDSPTDPVVVTCPLPVSVASEVRRWSTEVENRLVTLEAGLAKIDVRQALSTDRAVPEELPKLRKEVSDISARLATFEQGLQAALGEDEEVECGTMCAVDAGNDRGLADMGETFSLLESEITSSQATPRSTENAS